MNVAVIDDDVEMLGSIAGILAGDARIRQVHSAKDYAGGVELIRGARPDVLFLDVELSGRSGFELLAEIPADGMSVVFITAHEQYALRALKMSALEFLLKPFGADEVLDVIDKATATRNGQAHAARHSVLREHLLRVPETDLSVVLHAHEGMHIIRIRELVRCTSAGNYTEFHLVDGSRLVSSVQLGEYEEMLHAHNFCRIHRSHLVNIAHLRSVLKAGGGTVVMAEDTVLPISRRRKQELLEMLAAMKSRS
jgi:two-component system LytT family response regulator